MSTAPAASKRKWPFRIMSIAFPAVDELQFIMMLVVGIVLCLVNGKFGHMVSMQLKDGLSFSLLAIVFIILLVIATKEKLPDELKAWACLFYYGFFALIAHSALDHQNSQIHDSTLFASINLWFVYILLVLAIARGIVALLVVNSDRFNKFTAQSFSNSQYTLFGFSAGILISIVSTIIIGSFYHNPAQAALLSLTFANAGFALMKSLTTRRLTF